MKSMRLCFMAALSAAASMLLFSAAFAQQDAAEESGSGVNLAVVANALSSYVSGDTTLAALNDGYQPTSSRERRRGSYGNWPRRGTQWVQYDWSKAISTNKIDVYWWDVRLPKACRLLYWDGKAFIPVSNPSGLGVEESKYNSTTFDEVRTSKLRLEIDSNGTYSSGILEWKVYDSGRSPDFPPRVTAGVDRVVILGGKTYMNGAIKTLGSKGTSPVTWRKISGPGTVAFENASEPVTTATFSKIGDYVLRLSAGNAPLSASSTLTVKVKTPPPAIHLEPVATKTYKIDNPLWNSRAKALIVNWIPHCIRKISDPNLKEGGINNFIDAANKLAGRPHGRHRGYVFSNAWVYNTIESICACQGPIVPRDI